MDISLVWDGQRQDGVEVRLDGRVFSITGTDPWMISPIPVTANSGHQWQVRVLDERGEWSLWSDPATFETGPLCLADWSSSWVAVVPLSTIARDFVVGGGISPTRLH